MKTIAAVLACVLASLVLDDGIQLTSATLPQVCDPKVPAYGTVRDGQYVFSYKSWAEPLAGNADQYHYEFTNESDKGIPVRWSDAGIVSASSVAHATIETDQTDGIPPGLRPSRIAVGPEVAGEHGHDRSNCFIDVETRKQLDKGQPTTFHLRGRIANTVTGAIHDVNLTIQSIPGTGFEAETQRQDHLLIRWEIEQSHGGYHLAALPRFIPLEESRPVIYEQRAIRGNLVLGPITADIADTERNVFLSVRVLGWTSP